MAYEKLRMWINSQSYDFEDDLRSKRTIEQLQEYGKLEIEESIKEKILEKFPDDRSAFGAEKAIDKMGIEKFSNPNVILKKRGLRLGRLKSIKQRKERAEVIVRTMEERESIKHAIKRGEVRAPSGLRRRYRITEETAEETFRIAEQEIAEEQELAPLA